MLHPEQSPHQPPNQYRLCSVRCVCHIHRIIVLDHRAQAAIEPCEVSGVETRASQTRAPLATAARVKLLTAIYINLTVSSLPFTCLSSCSACSSLLVLNITPVSRFPLHRFHVLTFNTLSNQCFQTLQSCRPFFLLRFHIPRPQRIARNEMSRLFVPRAGYRTIPSGSCASFIS